MNRNAVLSIWIPNQGLVEQGKFCVIEGKKYFIANMTSHKEWTNYTGYSISKRVLDELPRGTTIVYKRLDLDCYLLSNKNTFQTKGILVAFGGHSQWVLPLKNWKAKSGRFENEPKNLPVMDLADWAKPEGKLVDMFSPDRRKEILGRIYA